jgi:hypothetical protein
MWIDHRGCEVAVAYFKVLSQYLPGGSKERHKNFSIAQLESNLGPAVYKVVLTTKLCCLDIIYHSNLIKHYVLDTDSSL